MNSSPRPREGSWSGATGSRAGRCLLGRADRLGPGFRRPVVVVQGDTFNRSRIATIVCVPLTSTVRLAEAPGNVLLAATVTGLPKDSVANVSQIVTVDRSLLVSRVGHLPRRQFTMVIAGIDLVLGR